MNYLDLAIERKQMNLLVLLTLLGSSVAIEKHFSGHSREICWGIYSNDYLKGDEESSISLVLNSFSKDPVMLSYIVFEYNDFKYIGRKFKGGNSKLICDDIAIRENLCGTEQMGQYLFDSKGELIQTGVITELNKPVIYSTAKTGYYCARVDVSSGTASYTGVFQTKHLYGYLSSHSLVSLLFYKILACLYVLLSLICGFLFYKSQNDTLTTLRLYLLLYMLFSAFDVITSWSYYDLLNYTANSTGFNISLYMVFAVLVNATKITVTIFGVLLLSSGFETGIFSEMPYEIKRLLRDILLVLMISSIGLSLGGYVQVTTFSDLFPWKYMFLIIMSTSFITGGYLAFARSLKQQLLYLQKSSNIQNFKVLFAIVLLSPILLVAAYATFMFIFYDYYGGSIVTGWMLNGWLVDVIPSTIFFIFCIISTISIMTMKDKTKQYVSLDQFEIEE